MNESRALGRPPARLLGEVDPLPVEVLNADGSAPLLLVCEHAGREVPASLGRLGLPEEEFARHIAYDIGAEGLARALSAALDAPLVLQRYSRLVVDCNRPPGARDFIPAQSDGTAVPGNRNLDAGERSLREEEIHAAFHRVVERLLSARLSRGRAALLAVHSFTPMLATLGRVRPWHAGFLFRRDDRLSRTLMAALLAVDPSVVAALNEPYRVTDEGDFTIPVHGEARGVPHTLLEIRNDLIATREGQAEWASRLAKALSAALPATLE